MDLDVDVLVVHSVFLWYRGNSGIDESWSIEISDDRLVDRSMLRRPMYIRCIRCTIMYDHVRSSGYVFVGRLQRFVCFAAVGGR